MKKETRGRKKLADGEARTETLRVRFTPEEMDAVKQQAKPVSDWARAKLLAGLTVKTRKGHAHQ